MVFKSMEADNFANNLKCTQIVKQLVIRKATVKDAEHIALLARITFTETFGKYFSDPNDLRDYFDKTFNVSKIRAGLQKENNVFFIALHDELPVGYAKLKKNSASAFIQATTIFQLQKIYVLKDFLSKGIGNKLLQHVFNETGRSGDRKIWLSVFTGNHKAIQFYKTNGFTPAGEHTFQIGKEIFDFIVMQKSFEDTRAIKFVRDFSKPDKAGTVV